MRLLPVAVLSLVLALAGCGGDADTAADPAPTTAPAEGDIPLTQRALAWLVADRLGKPDSARGDDDLGELGPDAIAVALRYRTTGEYDGDLVSVAVTSTVPEDLTSCEGAEDRYLDGCEQIAGGALLQWEEEEPEEDPGVLYVVVSKGETTVVVFQSGEAITGDPRESDLTVSVDDMIELAQDPRIDFTTSQEAVDAGEDLPYWSGAGD